MSKNITLVSDAERIVTDKKRCNEAGLECQNCFLASEKYTGRACSSLYSEAKELLDKVSGDNFHKFRVRIVETYTHEDVVMAKDWRDARERVEELWDNGKYETTGDQFTDVEYFVEEDEE